MKVYMYHDGDICVSDDMDTDKANEVYEEYSKFTPNNILRCNSIACGTKETYFPSRQTAVRLYNIIRNQLIDNNRALYGWTDEQLNQFCGGLFDMNKVYITLLAYGLVERQGGMIDFEKEVIE